MNKQTAVEWLMQKLEFVGIKDLDLCDDIYLQAKQIERQQIVDSFDYGFSSGYDDAQGDGATFEDGEQYYNETYK